MVVSLVEHAKICGYPQIACHNENARAYVRSLKKLQDADTEGVIAQRSVVLRRLRSRRLFLRRNVAKGRESPLTLQLELKGALTADCGSG